MPESFSVRVSTYNLGSPSKRLGFHERWKAEENIVGWLCGKCYAKWVFSSCESTVPRVLGAERVKDSKGQDSEIFTK